ncbi:type II toxin-antitoxin system HicB family antitoxin [Aerococcaceae bacterium zg-ZUI334]|uniref:type II toxin-antitoxin system HicB family antitoxin n=1 Tax=Aerococcaceae bacterium zg-252 TaxID=2796928 RepID=UPI001B9D1708|nr:type II toxin-antitoxin system HicB family antitoxin [Aerococcaceae bacterium zg-ZUI334]
MLISYPALFYYDETESVPYYIFFPDLQTSGTQGNSISEAIAMASEHLGIHLAHLIENGYDVPTVSNINDLNLIHNNPFKDTNNFLLDKSFISMVNADVAEYLGEQEMVKKTLSIPKWADRIGKELQLNFSKTLTDAITKEKLRA